MENQRPGAFFSNHRQQSRALNRLNEIIDPAVRNFITSYRLIETVRNTNRELDTVEIGLEDIKKDTQRLRHLHGPRKNNGRNPETGAAQAR